MRFKIFNLQQYTASRASISRCNYSAKVLDGRSIADQILDEIAVKTKQLPKSVRPGLAALQVGDRKDSTSYVRMKRRAAERCGFLFCDEKISADGSQQEIESKVLELNRDPSVHGIVVQLPLPKHIDTQRILDLVSPNKDVDGFNPHNMGQLAMKGRDPLFTPCTALGCLEILRRSNIPIAGKHAVVLGRSNIVGLPTSLLLMKADATVTICHSASQDLPRLISTADILIAALGKPRFVQKEWIKNGAVVLDVGITETTDSTAGGLGYQLVGDVDFDRVSQVASAITPVPGGVGPMTVAMLLQNTFEACLRSIDSLTPSKQQTSAR